MSFEKSMNKMKFDSRLLEYNLAQGFITQSDYDKFVAQLEDCSHLVAETSAEDLVADDESDDLDEELGH